MCQTVVPTALDSAVHWATILGPFLAAAGLLFTGYQMMRSLAVERGRFMLEIERMLATHDKTHLQLRPGGTWCNTRRGPISHEQWNEVDDYMGLFEHCELLIRSGVLDLATFKHLFEYRVVNILANPVIVQAKLRDERDGWLAFIALAERLQVLGKATPRIDVLTPEERKRAYSNS